MYFYIASGNATKTVMTFLAEFFLVPLGALLRGSERPPNFSHKRKQKVSKKEKKKKKMKEI